MRIANSTVVVTGSFRAGARDRRAADRQRAHVVITDLPSRMAGSLRTRQSNTIWPPTSPTGRDAAVFNAAETIRASAQSSTVRTRSKLRVVDKQGFLDHSNTMGLVRINLLRILMSFDWARRVRQVKWWMVNESLF